MIGSYQADPASMPAAPAGYQWVAVAGTPVPQLQKIQQSPLQQAFPFIAAGAVALAAWFALGKKRSIKLPVVPMP